MHDIKCGDYFEWYNLEFDDRHGDMITHLNNKRIFKKKFLTRRKSCNIERKYES